MSDVNVDAGFVQMVLAVYIFGITIYSFYVFVQKYQYGTFIPKTRGVEMITAGSYVCCILQKWYLEAYFQTIDPAGAMRPGSITAMEILLYAGMFVMYSGFLAGLICCQRRLIRWKKHHISLYALKEAVDDLPVGLCFFSRQGLPLMVNLVMQNVCREMTGDTLLNAFEFLKKIERFQIESWGDREQIYRFENEVYQI